MLASEIKTEVTRMAEELTGVKKMAWSLEAQNDDDE